MLDIRFIRENIEIVQKAIRDKGIDLDLIKLLDADKKRLSFLKEVEKWRAERNEISKKIGETGGEERTVLIKKMRERKDEMALKEEELKNFEDLVNELLLLTPNIPWSGTPVGSDESDNKEIKRVGELPKFDFEPRDHIELGKSLNIIDLDEGVKISGFRGYVLKNDGVLLHWAILMHAFKKITKRGFSPLLTPTIIKSFALIGSGHFPFGRREVFDLQRASHEGEDASSELLHLAGTSEPSILATKANRVLDKKDLPLKLCALTPCYRSEVGAYGKDAKGLYRVREFTKVEQVVICEPDLNESQRWFDEMLSAASEILEDFELPYHLIETCTGDMGAGKYRMVDIETWMPSRGSYGETHSCSNLTDWQARRLNMRFRNKTGEVLYPYTLNNTVIASPRILIPLLENHQLPDGGVKIPKVLQEVVGKATLEPKN